MHNFIKAKAYRLTVSFHVKLLNDIKIDKFEIEVSSNANKAIKRDKVHEVMNFQLKRFLKNIRKEKDSGRDKNKY